MQAARLLLTFSESSGPFEMKNALYIAGAILILWWLFHRRDTAPAEKFPDRKVELEVYTPPPEKAPPSDGGETFEFGETGSGYPPGYKSMAT